MQSAMKVLGERWNPKKRRGMNSESATMHYEIGNIAECGEKFLLNVGNPEKNCDRRTDRQATKMSSADVGLDDRSGLNTAPHITSDG